MHHLLTLLLICTPGSTVNANTFADATEPWAIWTCCCQHDSWEPQPLEPWLRRCCCNCGGGAVWSPEHNNPYFWDNGIVRPPQPWSPDYDNPQLWDNGFARPPWYGNPPLWDDGSIWRPVHELMLPRNPATIQYVYIYPDHDDWMTGVWRRDAQDGWRQDVLADTVVSPLRGETKRFAPMAKLAPEPSTLALLAIGAVALRRRRRR